MKWNETYKGAVAMQRVLRDTTILAETTPMAKAALAKAFIELELLKLRLRMKPAPKPVDVTEKGRRVHRQGDSLLAE